MSLMQKQPQQVAEDAPTAHNVPEIPETNGSSATMTNAVPPTGVAAELYIDAGTVPGAKATPETGNLTDGRTVIQDGSERIKANMSVVKSVARPVYITAKQPATVVPVLGVPKQAPEGTEIHTEIQVDFVEILGQSS
jgi:hypothetical protein